MVQVLDEVPGFGSQLGRQLGQNIGSGIETAFNLARQLKGKRAIESKFGKEIANLPPDAQQEFIKAFSKAEAQSSMMRELFGQKGQQNVDDGMSSGRSEQGSIDLNNLSAEDRIKLSMINPNISRQLTEEQKLKHKISSEEIKRGYEESKPTRERGRKIVEELPMKENALEVMKDAIQTGNLGTFSLDYLADLTGLEGLRSAEGAQFKTASKEFFLGNLGRIGAKGLNQMMEKVVMEMSPLIGRKPEANLAVAEILQAELDVSRKESELIHDLGQSYKEKHGHYPDDLSDRVYKELRPYAVSRQKEALENAHKIKEKYQTNNKNGVLMYDPSGNLRRVPHADVKKATQEGYRKG